MPDSLPWHHPTTDALAASLGVTTRSVELWRGQGAPIPAEGPFDEFAVRLWHAAGPGAAGGKRAATLAAPSGEPLTAYAAGLDALRAALRPDGSEDPERLYKREQALGQRLKNAERTQAFRTQAQAHFDRLLGTLLAGIDREELPLAAAVYDACLGKPRDQAEPAVRRLVRGALSTAIRDGLRAPVVRKARR